MVPPFTPIYTCVYQQTFPLGRSNYISQGSYIRVKSHERHFGITGPLYRGVGVVIQRRLIKWLRSDFCVTSVPHVPCLDLHVCYIGLLQVMNILNASCHNVILQILLTESNYATVITNLSDLQISISSLFWCVYAARLTTVVFDMKNIYKTWKLCSHRHNEIYAHELLTAFGFV